MHGADRLLVWHVEIT